MNAIQRNENQVPRVVSKPTGGFRPISVLQVCMAWWAYKSGILPRYLDFRVYLALHEIDERRLAASRVRARAGKATLNAVLPLPKLVAEIRTLTGGINDRLIRDALRRLESVGLVTITPIAISFATSVDTLRVDGSPEFAGMIRKFSRRVGIRERRLPVPRPMLRYLARGAPASFAATVFGYLIRCVWWRDRECHVAGSCTAGFISELFGVDERSVKRARLQLRTIGWLAPASTPDDTGSLGPSLPNLHWSGSTRDNDGHAGRCSRTDLSPLSPNRGTKMSPPTRSIQLRSGSKYQQPEPCWLAGIPGGSIRETRPRLSNVTPADLNSVERLDLLFSDAASRGLVKRTDADRLRFFAAAERANRVATRNPCGFFIAIVRRGLWQVISQRDEDDALRKRNSAQSQQPLPENSKHKAILVRSESVGYDLNVTPIGQNIESLVSCLTGRWNMCGMNNRPTPFGHFPKKSVCKTPKSNRSMLLSPFRSASAQVAGASTPGPSAARQVTKARKSSRSVSPSRSMSPN